MVLIHCETCRRRYRLKLQCCSWMPLFALSGAAPVNISFVFTGLRAAGEIAYIYIPISISVIAEYQFEKRVEPCGGKSSKLSKELGCTCCQARSIQICIPLPGYRSSACGLDWRHRSHWTRWNHQSGSWMHQFLWCREATFVQNCMFHVERCSISSCTQDTILLPVYDRLSCLKQTQSGLSHVILWSTKSITHAVGWTWNMGTSCMPFKQEWSSTRLLTFTAHRRLRLRTRPAFYLNLDTVVLFFFVNIRVSYLFYFACKNHPQDACRRVWQPACSWANWVRRLRPGGE
jgi:hypothetical protein